VRRNVDGCSVRLGVRALETSFFRSCATAYAHASLPYVLAPTPALSRALAACSPRFDNALYARCFSLTYFWLAALCAGMRAPSRVCCWRAGIAIIHYLLSLKTTCLVAVGM